VFPDDLVVESHSLFAGPIFTREAVVAPRRTRFYVIRAIYPGALLVLMATAWLVLNGTQQIHNVGDMARFGAVLFQVLAPLQMALMLFLSAIQSSSAVAVEKDKKTLLLLLMTRLSNQELVLGKLLASLLNVGFMLATAVPIFMMIVLFGGTSFQQVAWTFAVTVVAALAAGSFGSTISLWREKTFQSLALVALGIVFWIGAFEGIGLFPGEILGVSTAVISAAASPLQAILNASSPSVSQLWPTFVLPFLLVGSGLVVVFNAIGILRVRYWNPSRDVRPGQTEAEQKEAAGIYDDGSQQSTTSERSEKLRQGHVDARVRKIDTKSREVWNNPVFWREVRTWAYGKKIIFIRLIYWILAAIVAFAVFSMIQSDTAIIRSTESTIEMPPVARPLAPFMLVSLLMINALAVTSLTNERDGRSLDLLLVTDLSPKEFLFGKLGGVLLLSADIILIQFFLCGMLLWGSVVSLENFVYLLIGISTLLLFVAMLGIHCGMIYTASRQAIAVSLGTLFFLFLGIVTSMLIMVSFTGNVQAQMTPFLASIVGGGVGLYVVLGARNPSAAMAMAAGLLPLAMFFSITSILLGRYLSVFLVINFAFGFTTTAMMIPALGEFNISMGRARTTEDE
jgi:ABC-type transport system involved in multi-copper enzyme maturation permease subunit